MVRHLLLTQDQAQDHHSLPPPVQRHGGKVPQAVKEFLMCLSSLLQLVWTPATSASKAVYGSDLTLPGQFLEVQDPPTKLFYENLKNSMSGFQLTPPCHNTPAADTLPDVIPAELSSSPMVFIHKDGHVARLAPLYEGSYKVLSRFLKTFQLQVGKRVEVVSVQGLKPPNRQNTGF